MKIISDLEIGRGVVIYIKSVLSPIQEIIKNSIDKFNESVWAKIKLNATDTLLVGCIYCSPDSTRENTDLLSSLLRNVSKKKFSHILIMGDFNFNELYLNECTTTVGEDHIATLFLECVRDTFLCQNVKQPSRFREDQEPSTLDLIFTNDENMLDNLKASAGLGKSDHQILLFDFNCYISLNECKSKKYTFFKGNYIEMSKKLSSYNWNDLFRGMSLTNSWDCFMGICVKLLEKFMPENKAPTRMANHNPYVNSNVLSSIKKKERNGSNPSIVTPRTIIGTIKCHTIMLYLN